MKFFAYNDKLYSPNEFGSFTVVSRKLNEQFKLLDVLGDINDKNTRVIYPEVFDTDQKWTHHIPYLACEYSHAPQIVIDRLKKYNPLVLTISEFAKNNLINSGYNKVESVLLGTDSNIWYKTTDSKFDTFTYLTVNSSNERSGFEKLIPAFLEFSVDKNVRLIIKDGHNPSFKNYINQINCDKILYIDEMLSEDKLRILYNKSHIFLYANNTTSFGMNPMDAVLCETPCVVTMGSAIKEFIPEWTQPIKIKTTSQQITEQTVKDWLQIGLNCFPPEFLRLFPCPIYGERVNQKDISDALHFSLYNYNTYLNIVKTHKEYILDKYSWEICAKKLIEKVKNYDQNISR